MANNITVTTSQLKSQAGELRQQNGSLKTQIENLKTQETSLNSMWDGDANTAFHNAFQKDVEQMMAFYNAIEKYCGELENIAAQYDSVENVNKNLATSRSYK